MSYPPTGDTVQDQVMSIVDALHMQVVDYRNRYKLPPDHRMTVVFPHNEEIGRDVFELAERALCVRDIDVDWSMWPPEDAPEWQKQAWDTAPLGEADKIRHEKADFLLYPKGSFVKEPDPPIDLAKEKWTPPETVLGPAIDYASLCADLLAHGYTSGEAAVFLERAHMAVWAGQMSREVYRSEFEGLYCAKHDHLDYDPHPCSYLLEPQTAADNRKPIPVRIIIVAIAEEPEYDDIT